MRIIPVLDVKGSCVVRGVGGRRKEYRPVVSQLTDSYRPADVAQAFRDHFGFRECYVADLDAIAGAAPATAVYRELVADGWQMYVDAGVRSAAASVSLAGLGIAHLVVGLETISGPQELVNLCAMLGPSRVTFSLDLCAGKPLGDLAAWAPPATPEAIAAEAVAGGVASMIVLDLARVGEAWGTGTEGLCTRLAAGHPGVELIAGGGIRGIGDLVRLRNCGVHAVLVASALHDGQLQREDLQQL